ncbi:MAG: sigma-70 family RNA polymerase sigma factor [Cyanobacteria bacterium P01_G01_bin.38]
MNQARLDDLNQQLQALAATAQRYPALTRARQAALRQLVNGILQSGRLCRPQKGNFSGAYDDIYAEALQELLLYICQNIDKYSSERGTVMTWVNMLLQRRFFREAIPKVLGKPDMKRVTLPDLETVAAPETAVTPLDTLKESVEADPEDLFKSAHIRDHPDATFQALLQSRLSDQSWEAIATEFGISVSTASNFYYRCLTKFSSKLKEYCTGNST